MADIMTFDNRKYKVSRRALRRRPDAMGPIRAGAGFRYRHDPPVCQGRQRIYNLSQTLKGTDIGGANNTVLLALLTAGLDPAVHQQERTQHLRTYAGTFAVTRRSSRAW